LQPALAIWLLVVLALCGAGHELTGAPERGVLAVLRSRITRYLGKVSYSLYLVHMIVLYAVMYFLGLYAVGLSQWLFLSLLLLVTVVLSVGAASVLFRFIEQPFIDMGRRLSKQARVSFS
jgi:peptidoglycan/LPS O-acetylase OafA/YrhL